MLASAVEVVQRVQMNRGGNRLAGGETGKTRLAAERQRRQARAAFAQGPLEEWIMAATDDWAGQAALCPQVVRCWRRASDRVRPSETTSGR